MATTSTEDRALALLGQGHSPEVVASAIGVTTSRISQLVSDPEFAARVAELRFSSLVKHNTRDEKYDSLEDKLLAKMENMLEYMHKPFEVLKAIQVINAAKRRGVSAPEQITAQQVVIPLTLPTLLVQNFGGTVAIGGPANQNIQVNANNQVIKAGEQELVTIQSHRMDALLARISPPSAQPGNSNVIENSAPA